MVGVCVIVVVPVLIWLAVPVPVSVKEAVREKVVEAVDVYVVV